MRRLFKEVHQCYISSKMLSNQNTDVYKILCLIEFVYAYQVNVSFARTEISFQNILHIFKPLTRSDMQY